MRVRALDVNNDWTYGKGQNDYKTANNAVAQSIQTRLNSFLGDCPFDLGAGINWFGFLGGKNQLALNLAISAVILNTPTSASDPTPVVTGIKQLSVNLDHTTRIFTILFQVQTIFSAVSGTFSFDLNGSQ